MGIMRENKDLLLTILETFLHDPLCEWKSRKGIVRESGETHLNVIDKKLSGRMSVGLPMGVEGQVDELIEQARDISNLARMYIGRFLSLFLDHGPNSIRVGAILVKEIVKI